MKHIIVTVQVPKDVAFTVLTTTRIKDSKGGVWPVQLCVHADDIRNVRGYRGRDGHMCHPMDLYVVHTGKRLMPTPSDVDEVQSLCDDYDFMAGVNRKMESIGYDGPLFDRAELGMQCKEWVVCEASAGSHSWDYRLYDLYKTLKRAEEALKPSWKALDRRERVRVLVERCALSRKEAHEVCTASLRGLPDGVRDSLEGTYRC